VNVALKCASNVEKFGIKEAARKTPMNSILPGPKGGKFRGVRSVEFV
jgi:hypothetical protein